jgi:hypothetical protein
LNYVASQKEKRMPFQRGQYFLGTAGWAGCPRGVLLEVTPGTKQQPNPAKAVAVQNADVQYSIQTLLDVFPSAHTRGPFLRGPRFDVVASTLKLLREGKPAEPIIVLDILKAMRTQRFYLDPQDSANVDPSHSMAVAFDLDFDIEIDVQVWTEGPITYVSTR